MNLYQAAVRLIEKAGDYDDYAPRATCGVIAEDYHRLCRVVQALANRDERVEFEAWFRRESSACNTTLDEWFRLDGSDYADPHAARDFMMWQAAVASVTGMKEVNGG